MLWASNHTNSCLHLATFRSMDALDALEFATQAGSMLPSSSGQSAASDGSCRTFVTPSKKRRRGDTGSSPACGSSNAGRSPAASHVKGEDVEEADDDMEGASLGVVEFCQVKEECKDKKSAKVEPCLGCKRVYLSNTCWFEVGAEVGWAFPKGRGAWCRECHSCWRTCFSHEHSLQLFGPWIRTATNNLKFQIHLMAHLSLVKEGIMKVNLQMVADRITVTKYILGLLGMPLAPSVVVPIFDLNEASLQAAVCDPNLLVNMVIGGKQSLGLFVEQDLAASGGTILRPLNGFPCMPSWQLLNTVLPKDSSALAEHFGALAGEVQFTVKKEEATLVIAQSKTQVKFEALRCVVQPLLNQFKTALWTSAKESSFTGYLAKISAVHAEASSQGDRDLISQAEAWIEGLSAGKQFLKLNRDYTKSTFKQPKLIAMGVHLQKFREFALKEGQVVFYDTLELLWHKVVFFDTVARDPAEGSPSLPLACGLQVIFANGLAKIFTVSGATPSASSSSGCAATLSMSAWLRSPIFKVCCDSIMAMKPDEVDTAATALLADIDASLQLLQSKVEELPDLVEMIEDHRDFATILRCTCNAAEALASDVGAALQKVNMLRFAPIKAALHESDAGKVLLSAATCALQLSAKDSCGDFKLSLASKILNDPRLPSLMLTPEDGIDGCIQNFSLISGLGVIDILEESQAHVMESITLWSSARLEQQCGGLRTWLDDVMKVVLFCDESLSLYLDATVVSGKLAEILLGDGSEWSMQDELAAIQELSSRLEKDDVEEEPFQLFLESFCKFLHSLPDVIKRKVSFVDDVALLREKVLSNISCRGKIKAALVACTRLTEVPQSSRDALDEWSSKRALGNEANSYLVLGVSLLVASSHMSPTSLNLGTDDGEVRMCFREGEGIEDVIGSRQQARDLTGLLGRLKLIAYVNELNQECLQIAIADFAASLHLHAFVLEDCLPVDGSEVDLPKHLDNIIDSVAVAETTKATAKIFATATAKKEKLWQSNGLHELLEQLCQVIPASSFKFSVGPLCKPGTLDEEASMINIKSAPILINQVSVLFKNISQIALTLAYLRTRFVSTAESSIRENKIKSEVEHAVNFVRHVSNKTLEDLERGIFDNTNKELATVQWTMPVTFCKKWLARVKAVTPAMCKFFVLRSTEALSELSAEVQACTPTYGHIVSDTSYHATLARKQILKWPSRENLNIKTVSLFNVLADLVRVHTSWALQPSIKEDVDCKEVVVSAHCVFDTAKAAITLVAALAVLMETTGEERIAKATNLLLSKKDALPKMVVAELQKVIDGNPSTTVAVKKKV